MVRIYDSMNRHRRNINCFAAHKNATRHCNYIHSVAILECGCSIPHPIRYLCEECNVKANDSDQIMMNETFSAHDHGQQFGSFGQQFCLFRRINNLPSFVFSARRWFFLYVRQRVNASIDIWRFCGHVDVFMTIITCEKTRINVKKTKKG